MTKKQTSRIAAVAPNGIPRWLRIYDNGGTDVKGGTIDRFTVIFTTAAISKKCGGQVPHLCMSSDPFYPQGFCQHETYDSPCDTLGRVWPSPSVRPPAIGRKCHLGRRIAFTDLPADCQRAVWQDYSDYWDIPNPLVKSPASVTVKG